MPTLDRPGGPLHYEVTDVTAPWAGEPETILFHHGVGITGDIWLEWLPPLADRYRLVRLDVRGFGRSSVPGPGFAWSMELLAEDARAVARAAGAARFHYVGESLGGTLGLWLAVHQRMAPDVPARYREWFDAEQAKCSADAILDLADMLVATDISDRLETITAPTLVLHPDASPFIPLPMALELHARIPRSEIRIFPGARHALAHTHAVACATALREFLARRGPARPS